MFDRPDRPDRFDVVRLTRNHQPTRRAVPVSGSGRDYRTGQASFLLILAVMTVVAIYLGASWIYGLVSPAQHHAEAANEAPVEPATHLLPTVIPVAIVASAPPPAFQPPVAVESEEAAIIEPAATTLGEEADPAPAEETEMAEAGDASGDASDIVAANRGVPSEGIQMARFQPVYPARLGTPDQQAIAWLAQGQAILEVTTARGDLNLRVTRMSPVQFELHRPGAEGEVGSAMVLDPHPIDHRRIGLALADLLQSTDIRESRIRFTLTVFAMIRDAQERTLAALAAAGQNQTPETLEIEICLEGSRVGVEMVRDLSSRVVLLAPGECR
jgi:hypothetical protein